MNSQDLTDDYIPQTTKELEQWMIDHCYHFESYSINGNSIYEGCGIDKADGQFIWYYTERGESKTLKTFSTESEIVAYAFQEIKTDQWARTHCIGFTEDKNKAEELTDILVALQIPYTEDQIPYSSREHPAYRTFVMGCDIKRVEHLQEKYGYEQFLEKRNNK